MGNKALSHDSVFIFESPPDTASKTSSQENLPGKVKALQVWRSSGPLGVLAYYFTMSHLAQVLQTLSLCPTVCSWWKYHWIINTALPGKPLTETKCFSSEKLLVLVCGNWAQALLVECPCFLEPESQFWLVQCSWKCSALYCQGDKVSWMHLPYLFRLWFWPVLGGRKLESFQKSS